MPRVEAKFYRFLTKRRPLKAFFRIIFQFSRQLNELFDVILSALSSEDGSLLALHLS